MIDKNLESGKEDVLNNPTNNSNTTDIDGTFDIEENVSNLSEKTLEDSNTEFNKMSKPELMELLKNYTTSDEIPSRHEVNSIRHAINIIRQREVDKEREEFEDNAEKGEIFEPSKCQDDDLVLSYLNTIKERRNAKTAKEDKEKEDNFNKKTEIIAQIKDLVDSQEDFHTLHKKFIDLQSQWKQIGHVASNKVKDLWREYQIYTEKFYDIKKINDEMRDYDFKKNLELKNNIIEAASKLTEEIDSISAFHQLQKLHEQWRDVGPVEKDLRDEVWDKFKEISSEINKKFQAHFENLKATEEENLKLKQAIIDEMQSVDLSLLKNFKDWETATAKVIDLQGRWKAIGFVPKKYNAQIFQNFRKLCDDFFDTKSNFFKGTKVELEKNLQQKQELLKAAISLKESTDWDKTTQDLVKIQKAWKTIGPVPRKFSDSIWKEFVAACDYFFEQKKKVVSSQKEAETTNYKAKKGIVEKIKNISESLTPNEIIEEIKKLQDEWYKIGHVPFKEKDRAYKELYAAIDKHYDKLKIDKSEREFAEFKSNIENKLAKDGNAERVLNKEKEYLIHQYNKTKNDLLTYENNLTFLSNASKNKGDNPLFKDVNKKIEALKNHLTMLQKKISEIDSNLSGTK